MNQRHGPQEMLVVFALAKDLIVIAALYYVVKWTWAALFT